MANVNCYYTEDRRFHSFFGWLRATQHCGCNKWVPTCRWLQSDVEGRLELVKWGIKGGDVITAHTDLTMNLQQLNLYINNLQSNLLKQHWETFPTCRTPFQSMLGTIF